MPVASCLRLRTTGPAITTMMPLLRPPPPPPPPPLLRPGAGLSRQSCAIIGASSVAGAAADELVPWHGGVGGCTAAQSGISQCAPTGGSEGRRRSLLRPYSGAQGAAAAAERGGRAVRDGGRQRGRAGRRHAAPRCALRPSLPSSFHCSSSGVHLPRPATRSRPFDPAAVRVN